MTERLHLALDRLVASLAAKGDHMGEGLAPGLPEDSVRSHLAEIGIDAPEELVGLFAWCDGNETWSPEHHGMLGAGLVAISLEHAIEIYEEQERFGLDPDLDVGPHCFPIFGAGGGWMTYLMDCGDGPGRGSVLAHWMDDVTPRAVRPVTLAEMLERAADLVDLGVWHRLPAGGWVDDTPDDVQRAKGFLF